MTNANLLAAVTQTELAEAQKGILAHVDNRLASLQTDLDMAEANLQHAIKSHWGVKPFRAAVSKIKAKVAYYEKVKAAVGKGYLVIPDVWGANPIAIRVKDKNTVRWTTCWRGDAEFKQPKLPAGEGVYIDHKPLQRKKDIEADDGKIKSVAVSASGDDSDIDWPVALVHPAVIQATDIAMADKIFDTIKIARQGGDPFIIGEIKRDTYRSIHFFIAWFLDVRTI